MRGPDEERHTCPICQRQVLEHTFAQAISHLGVNSEIVAPYLDRVCSLCGKKEREHTVKELDMCSEKGADLL